MNDEHNPYATPQSDLRVDSERARELVGDASKRRLFAMAIDNLVSLGLALFVGSRLPIASPLVLGTVASLVWFGYYFVQEANWSTTVGKRICGLVIADLTGKPCGVGPAFIRTALRLVEVNPFILGAVPGGMMVVFTKRKQRVGDLLGHTVVVRRDSAGSAEAV